MTSAHPILRIICTLISNSWIYGKYICNICIDYLAVLIDSNEYPFFIFTSMIQNHPYFWNNATLKYVLSKNDIVSVLHKNREIIYFPSENIRSNIQAILYFIKFYNLELVYNQAIIIFVDLASGFRRLSLLNQKFLFNQSGGSIYEPDDAMLLRYFSVGSPWQCWGPTEIDSVMPGDFVVPEMNLDTMITRNQKIYVP